MRRLALAILLLLGACGGPKDADDFQGLVDLRAGPPNVVVVALDTWRADHMGAYGSDRVRTPALDRFADEAIVFEDCGSTSTWTLPAFASVFTGLLPSEHRTIGGTRSVLPDSLVTMAERLQIQGYVTTAFVAVDYLAPPFGLERGFAEHRNFSEWVVNGRLTQYERLLARAIQSPPEQPWFLLAHYFDAHDPYEPPDEFDRMYYEGDETMEPEDPARSIEVIYSERNRIQHDPRMRYRWLRGVRDLEFPVRQYAGGISYVDHHAGAALDSLRATGLMDRSIVIVLADHGEHLTEHDIYFTHRLPYSETLQVPLMVRLPGAKRAGLRIREPVSLADVLPTVMDLVGHPVEDAVSGTSLVPLMEGGEIPPRLLFAEYGGREGNWAKSVWDARWRYTEIRLEDEFTVELFDRRADKREERNLASAHPELVKLYSAALDLRFGPERRLVQERGAKVPEVEIDPAILDRLRALGYIDGGN